MSICTKVVRIVRILHQLPFRSCINMMHKLQMKAINGNRTLRICTVKNMKYTVTMVLACPCERCVLNSVKIPAQTQRKRQYVHFNILKLTSQLCPCQIL